mmetsp:Transcript_4718/g.13225  ORF Transcript_4718/g.13225 Transcript_4718/m.13225 type:complete len:201 (+) Transcript_4718:273-875(+)
MKLESLPRTASSSRLSYAEAKSASGPSLLLTHRSSSFRPTPRPSPGVLVTTLRYTARSGCTRRTSSLRISSAWSPAWKGHATDRYCTRTSALAPSMALPALRMKGTPCQRSVSMWTTTAAKVGVREPAGAPPASASAAYPAYCPSTQSSARTGRILLMAFTFSSLTSSPSAETGRSMVSSASTCTRWFCSTSLTMPNPSK